MVRLQLQDGLVGSQSPHAAWSADLLPTARARTNISCTWAWTWPCGCWQRSWPFAEGSGIRSHALEACGAGLRLPLYIFEVEGELPGHGINQRAAVPECQPGAAAHGAGLHQRVAHARNLLHRVHGPADASDRDAFAPHLAQRTQLCKMLEGVGSFLSGEGRDEPCAFPGRQLPGLQVQDAEHVLAGISGHDVSIRSACTRSLGPRSSANYLLQWNERFASEPFCSGEDGGARLAALSPKEFAL